MFEALRDLHRQIGRHQAPDFALGVVSAPVEALQGEVRRLSEAITSGLHKDGYA